MESRKTRSRYQNNQFVISHELLALLQWLIENERNEIQDLITNAILNKNNLENGVIEHTEEDQHSIVIDFFALLEEITHDTSQENEVNAIVQRNIIPAIKHIDTMTHDNFDNLLVAKSAQKAQTDHEINPEKDPNNILYKELLKRWKPSKRITID